MALMNLRGDYYYYIIGHEISVKTKAPEEDPV
jgi:hypothetical protein